MPCIDEDTAEKMVGFIGEMLEKSAKGSPTDILDCYGKVKEYHTTLP
jgi:hypothetical protein